MSAPENNQPEIIRRQSNVKLRRGLAHWLIGQPLMTADASHQTIGKATALAIFASDALSSTAYSTQEILVILAVAGMTVSYRYLIPISLLITGLIAIISISYRQIVHAYPNGGGAYTVALDNFGHFPALVAASALLTEYILTVSVSVASGVAQIVSAYPELFSYRVEIAVVCVLIMTVINLRGLREVGLAFALPSYFFILMMFIAIGRGLFFTLTGSLGDVMNPPQTAYFGEALTGVTAFLLLHAFSSGTTALTGVDAISNSVTAFKEPRSRNAGITLFWMALLMGFLLLGVSYLTREMHAVPSEEETVISQLARTVFNGRGLPYLLVIFGTTTVLILAANTAFAGFPRLSAILARDGFMPRQLTNRGSRLVYSSGILSLAVMACLLIIIFQASVTRLIPMYAVGIFLSFTLAQAGMARRWWRVGRPKESLEIAEPGLVLQHEKSWRFKMLFSGFGALCTFLVMLVFAVTKFRDGSWFVLILIPILVTIFFTIYRHYEGLALHLSLDKFGRLPDRHASHRVVIPVSGIHQGTLDALNYARLLSKNITAVHVSLDPTETEKVQNMWKMWGGGTRLIVLDSPFRLFIEPLFGYLEEIIDQRQPNETITVIVPQFVPTKRWHNALHMRTADVLRRELLSKHGVVVIDFPYYEYNEERA